MREATVKSGAKGTAGLRRPRPIEKLKAERVQDGLLALAEMLAVAATGGASRASSVRRATMMYAFVVSELETDQGPAGAIAPALKSRN
jgi:hypothetical protein